MSDIVYRGASLESLNENEFLTHSIDGNLWPVWFAEMDQETLERTKEDSDISFWRLRGFDDEFLQHVTGEEQFPITGGLTGNLATATNFASTGRSLGAVLHLDRSRIPAEVVEIQYDPEWYDDHPGVVAHVDTLTEGEVHINDKLWGLVQENQDGQPYISEWGEQARNKGTWNRFSDEGEMVSFTDEIDLDDTLMAAVGYYKLPSASSKTVAPLDIALKSLPWWEHRNRPGRDIRGTGNKTDKELTEAIYEETVGMYQWREEDLYIVVIEDDRDFTRDSRGVPRDEFMWAYDGERFIEDYDEAGALVGEGNQYPNPSASSSGGGLAIPKDELMHAIPTESERLESDFIIDHNLGHFMWRLIQESQVIFWSDDDFLDFVMRQFGDDIHLRRRGALEYDDPSEWADRALHLMAGNPSLTMRRENVRGTVLAGQATTEAGVRFWWEAEQDDGAGVYDPIRIPVTDTTEELVRDWVNDTPGAETLRVKGAVVEERFLPNTLSELDAQHMFSDYHVKVTDVDSRLKAREVFARAVGLTERGVREVL